LLMYNLYGQSSVFIAKAEDIIMVKDSTMNIDHLNPTSNPYDFLTNGSDKLEELFISNLKSSSQLKNDELLKSHTLSTLAKLATDVWKGSQYSKDKKWKELSKYFKRAAHRSTSNFNFMKEVSFRISLIDNFGKKFYYDKKGSLANHHLYSGEKPKNNNEEDENYIEPVPLEYFSEVILVEKFMIEIKRKGLMLDLKKGLYSYIGLSVEIDENTLYKNRIPTMRVVLLLGARRLQRVKVSNAE